MLDDANVGVTFAWIKRGGSGGMLDDRLKVKRERRTLGKTYDQVLKDKRGELERWERDRERHTQCLWSSQSTNRVSKYCTTYMSGHLEQQTTTLPTYNKHFLSSTLLFHYGISINLIKGANPTLESQFVISNIFNAKNNGKMKGLF